MQLCFNEVEHVCSPMLGVGAELQDIWARARALKELLEVVDCIFSKAFGYKATWGIANENRELHFLAVPKPWINCSLCC
jgi:hypothetical protein